MCAPHSPFVGGGGGGGGVAGAQEKRGQEGIGRWELCIISQSKI